jgi:hypothetical protein
MKNKSKNTITDPGTPPIPVFRKITKSRKINCRSRFFDKYDRVICKDCFSMDRGGKFMSPKKCYNLVCPTCCGFVTKVQDKTLNSNE